jgi:hypothetical protein
VTEFPPADTPVLAMEKAIHRSGPTAEESDFMIVQKRFRITCPCNLVCSYAFELGSVAFTETM